MALGPRVKLLGWCCAVWFVSGGACRSANRSAPAPGNATPPAPAPIVLARTAPDPPAPDLGDPRQQFLVHAQSGEIALRSRATRASRVLAKHADTVFYHPSLELVWFLDGDRLSVIDLRAPGTPPVTVARGATTVGHFSISRPPNSVETEDGCDVPYISLDWTEKPKVEIFLTEAPNLRIEDAAWLHSQLARPARADGKRQEFSKRRVRLPAKVLDCADKADCGTTVPFGARGLDLVRVLDKPGGDCIERACLLRDRRTHLFASPLQTEVWGSAETTRKGTCGLFLFDQAGTAFLVGNHLCLPGHPCEDLGAHALGWLVPGDTVGAPGNFAEP